MCVAHQGWYTGLVRQDKKLEEGPLKRCVRSMKQIDVQL